MSEEEIWIWLSSKGYDYIIEDGFRFYNDLDMPKILDDYYRYRSEIGFKTEVKINTNFGNIQM